MSEELREVVVSDWSTYNPGDHQTIKTIIKNNINNAFSSMIANGYYLNIVYDRKYYKDDGFSGIGEYAEATYGIPNDKCSYLMRVARRFCIQGSPALLPEYREFTLQKLREMSYLTDEQLEQVTITTTRAEIREMKKPEKEKVAPAQLEPESTKTKESVFMSHNEAPEIDFTRGLDSLAKEFEAKGSCPPEQGSLADSSEQKQEESLTKNHDESWFVKQYFDRNSDSLAKLMRMCRETKSRGEVAKEFQQFKARYGHSFSAGHGYCFTFMSFTGGVDLEVKGEKIHLKYGRLVEEALKIYNPFDPAYDEPKPNDTLEIADNAAEIVNDVLESENDNSNITEKECSNCEYYDMAPERYREIHPDTEVFPCNDCDDKLNHWIPKTESKESVVESVDPVIDEESFPCDTCGHENDAGCCDYDTEDQFCVLGNAWIPKAAESEQIETVEAEIVQTVPEDPGEEDYERYTFHDVRDEYDKLDEYVTHYRRNNDTMPGRRKAKMRLDAITLLREDMQKPKETETPEQVQPELPVLKNNDQRKEWIENYSSWMIWIDNKETGERYYRYDFENGDSFVIKVYWCSYNYYDYTLRKSVDEERYYHQEEYILKPGKLFKNCYTCTAAMVDYLKDIQKKRGAYGLH